MLAAAALYVLVLETGFGPATPAPVRSEPAPAPAPAPAQIVAPAAPRPTTAGTPTPTLLSTVAAPPPLAAAGLLQGDSPDWLFGPLQSNPQVFAIAFAGLGEQARAMNRLAAFMEKASAPRERLLVDAELAALIARSGDLPETFYLGHDYRIADVARFFNQARQQRLVLLAQEQRLLQTLQAAAWITKTLPYQASAPERALITLGRLSSSDRRLLKLAADDQVLGRAVLAHEISHGEFLTRPAYRQQCWHFWKALLSESERQKWRLLLTRMDYDAGNEELLVNEMQALLMHTPDGRVFGAVHLLISESELDRQRQRFGQAGKALAP